MGPRGGPNPGFCGQSLGRGGRRKVRNTGSVSIRTRIGAAGLRTAGREADCRGRGEAPIRDPLVENGAPVERRKPCYLCLPWARTRILGASAVAQRLGSPGRSRIMGYSNPRKGPARRRGRRRDGPRRATTSRPRHASGAAIVAELWTRGPGRIPMTVGKLVLQDLRRPTVLSHLRPRPSDPRVRRRDSLDLSPIAGPHAGIRPWPCEPAT